MERQLASKRFAARLLATGAACALACSLWAAGPAASQGHAEEVAQKDKAAAAMAAHAPEVVTLEDGTQVQVIPNDPYLWNTTSLKGDQRGCVDSGCHSSILEATQEMAMPHPELWNPYGVDPTIKFCYMCHSKALFFQDSMHAIHNTSAQFSAMGGSCDSCHYVSPQTGEFLMWDLVKYTNAYMGVMGVSDLSAATFSFTQDTITPTDQVFYYWENNDHRGVTPDNDTSAEAYENWEITVGGDAVANGFTFRLGDYADQMVERTFKMDCQTNPPGGAYIANVQVKGIPLSVIMEDAGVDPAATVMHSVADDGWDVYPLPMDFVNQYLDNFMLVTEINGEPLGMLQGYPVQLWTAPTGGCHYTKRVVELNFTFEEATPKIFMGFTNPKTGEMFNKPNTSIFGYKNGTVFPVGETIVFEGFADAFDVPVTAVEISMDKGKTWTTYELGETDYTRWVNWKFEFTPEKAGGYLLQVRAIGADGSVSTDPSQLFFNAK